MSDPGVAIDLVPIDLAVARASWSIPRSVLRDPWDRVIVATAMVLDAGLVSADAAIREAQLVPVVW